MGRGSALPPGVSHCLSASSKHVSQADTQAGFSELEHELRDKRAETGVMKSAQAVGSGVLGRLTALSVEHWGFLLTFHVCTSILL